MYPLFPRVPASIVELGRFRVGKALIFRCFFVGFSGRFTAWTGGFWVATLGLDYCFLKGWQMKLIRSLGTLVMLGSVSWMLGCTADETTSGPGAVEGGSGVAGGAMVPHSHDGEVVHEHEGDAPTTEEPMTETPVDDAPITEEPKTEVPAIDAPTTDEPKTEVPADDAPTTEEPTTETPADEAPKSE